MQMTNMPKLAVKGAVRMNLAVLCPTRRTNRTRNSHAAIMLAMMTMQNPKNVCR